MKKTKQSEKKVNGNKISFRINKLEDRKISEYMDKVSNGSAFIKEAIRFYIKNIEAGRIDSYWLQNEDDLFNGVVIKLMEEDDIKENDKEDDMPNVPIDEIDTGHVNIFSSNPNPNRIELKPDNYNFDYEDSFDNEK